MALGTLAVNTFTVISPGGAIDLPQRVSFGQRWVLVSQYAGGDSPDMTHFSLAEKAAPWLLARPHERRNSASMKAARSPRGTHAVKGAKHE
jgi:hypothetical protein